MIDLMKDNPFTDERKGHVVKILRKKDSEYAY